MKDRLGVKRRYVWAALIAASASSITACANIIEINPKELNDRALDEHLPRRDWLRREHSWIDADTNAPVMGLSATCGSCHLRREKDGYLFGVPSDYLQ
jgi:hypothetical protein